MSLNLIIILLVVVSILIALRNRKKLNLSARKSTQLKINEWMDMSDEERFILDQKEKAYRLERQNILINKIRKEYKNSIKKAND